MTVTRHAAGARQVSALVQFLVEWVADCIGDLSDREALPIKSRSPSTFAR
ncbi:hypothetical protein NVV99_18605 [Rhodococcus sp. PAE-6]|nr:hypothetical protein [Rhodococcus sp. PAE-6]MCT7292946.1 hypothetical protein [Rhodococcus sp. PAE-6]